MNDKSFNLLHEKWIVVMKPDGSTEEVSLLGLFSKAHHFLRLAGELPTQDIAVLRLLLAIMHAVFARYDLDGQWAPISSPYDALERWKTLWDAGALPEDTIENYLLRYEDRFYLFHPDRPFYQVASLGEATDYSAAKLNGELSESGNKSRLFPQRAGSAKSGLTCAEAARWLLYVNAFDDTSAKPKKKGLPSPGAGWLGKLGIIAAVGDNLYETLLLNLVLLKDGGDELWGAERPVWEAETVRSGERTEIVVPDNPSALLTLQSRRLLLRRQEKAVTGYSLLGGDFFPKENALNEQMTLWRKVVDKNSKLPQYHPKRHDPARQLWRDFSALAGQAEGGRRPGVVTWLARLKIDNLIPRSHFRFQTAAVKYGDKDFFVDDVFGDSISFSGDLLTDLGASWVHRIIDEINTTGMLVEHLGHLGQNVARAEGSSDGNAERETVKEQAFFSLDRPFRSWLEAIDPHRDDLDQVCDNWWEQARRIVRRIGGDIVSRCGPRAFTGRYLSERGTEVQRHYSVPEAYQWFLYRTSTRQALKTVKKGGKDNG